MRASPLPVLVSLLALAPVPVRAAEDLRAEATRLLASRKWEERVQGLEALEKIGKDARAEKAAIEALADPDWGVAIRAARAAAVVGGEPAATALAEVAYRGAIQWLRDAAVEAARGLAPDRATARLLHAVKVEKEDLPRTRAIEALGRLGAADDLKRLRVWLRAKDVHLAAAAVRAVGRIAAGREAGNAVARDAATHTLVEVAEGARGDKDDFLSYVAALEGLAEIGTPAARAALVTELLAQPDDDGYVPERIARGLAAVPPAEVADLLRPSFAKAKVAEAHRLARLAARLGAKSLRPEVEALLAHRDMRVRSEAARALGLLGDPEAGKAAVAVLADPEARVRAEGVTAAARLLPPADFRALGERLAADASEEVRLQAVVEVADQGQPEGVAFLERFAGDKAWRVATAAIASIGTLGAADDLPKVEPASRQKAWQHRAAAFEAMGRLRAAKAIPLLIEGLLDKDPVVRGTCHANLQILTSRKGGPDPKSWREWWARNAAELVLLKRGRGQRPEVVNEDEEVVVPGDGRYVPDSRAVHTRYTRKRGVEILQKARILVVSGAWDKAEKVLEHLSIPHTLLRAQEIKEAGLNPNQVVLVNCEGNVDKEAAQRLRWFVNVGGYLMATDWAVTKAVADCFPGYVRQFSGSSTGNDVVVVEEATPGHPFTKGIFEGVPALTWWLEIQAFPVTVAYPERCEVIVDSAQMRQRYGASAMATTFRWGLGKVQHSVSHFFLQEEGMVKQSDAHQRMVFAADNLGLSIEQIRRMNEDGKFEGRPTEATMKEIAPDYSMFRMIVNVVREKSDWVEGL